MLITYIVTEHNPSKLINSSATGNIGRSSRSENTGNFFFHISAMLFSWIKFSITMFSFITFKIKAQ